LFPSSLQAVAKTKLDAKVPKKIGAKDKEIICFVLLYICINYTFLFGVV
jgi:hypothetical protein